MKNISTMTAEELGKVLWDLFGGDDREFLENCGYVEDNLSDHYERADIAAISPETWAIAWDNYDRRRGGATMGRKGGKSRSDAKTSAARENGKRGGRPRKETIIEFGGERRAWIGAWPAKRNSARLVAVLAGTSHSGIMEVGAEYLGTHRDRYGTDYDWYRLPSGARLV